MKKNIFANFVGKIWGLFSNFLFIPIYIKYLGFESYSLISYTLVLAGILAILDGGLTATLSREFSRKDRSDYEKIKTYETLEIIYMGITVFSIILICFFSNIIAEKLKVKTLEAKDLSYFLKIISFDLGFQLLFRFYLGGLFGSNKQILGNIIQTGWGIFRNGIVVILILFIPNLELFFLWQAFATIIFTFIIKFYLDKFVYKKNLFKINLKYCNESFNKVKHFIGGMFLISVISVIGSQTDKILISKMLNLEVLGYYTLAISVSSILIIIVSPIATAVLPILTGYFSKNDLGSAKEIFRSYNLYISILVFSFLVNIILYDKNIIWVWTNDMTLVERSYKFVSILASGYAFMVLQTMCFQVALAKGYTKLNTYIGIFNAIIIIPSYYYFGSLHGAYGIACTFMILQFANYITFVYFINKKFINENFIKNLVTNSFLLPLIITALSSYLLSRFAYIFEHNRMYMLFWMGFSIFFAIVVTSLILLPKVTKNNFIKLVLRK